MKSMLKLRIVIVFYLLAFLSAKSQDCDPAQLAKIPGTWKSNKEGSIQNVSASDLTRERNVLAKINESMKAGYTPVGGVLSYSNFFSIPIGEGKNWLANPYGQSMRFLEYVCKRDPKATPAYAPNLETSAVVTFYINQISGTQEFGGGFNLYAAQLPDDHHSGYFLLEKWPEQQGDLIFWELQTPSERYPIGQKVWILTYPGKSPLVSLTKKEYLTLKIPLLKKSQEEAQCYHKEIDPNFDAASKRIYEESLLNLKAQEELILSVEALLRSMSPAELSEPAIIERGEPQGEFRGFKSKDDPLIYHLVKPNLTYFNPELPKWVPQLITVHIQYDINEQINFQNIKQMEAAINWDLLRNLLGKQ